MKFILKSFYVLVFVLFPFVLSAQNVWKQLNDFQGTARQGAVSFVIGDYAYIGTGKDAIGELKDFWKYDPSNDSWTQVKDFPGAAREEAVAFTLNGKGYVGLGAAGSTRYKDFYTYDPVIDDWIQVADFGGSARSSAVAFAIGDFAYVGTGRSDVDEEKDFWQYDYVNDEWNQIADLNADKRRDAVAFAIDGKGYVSGGIFFDSFSFQLSDVQEFDPATGMWTERIFADGINLSFNGATSFVKDGIAYICYGNKSQVVTYDPVSNNVTDLGDVLSIGGFIFDPTAFTIGDNGYLGLGNSGTLLSKIWRFGLPDLPNAPSSLSFENPAPGEVRISWTDESNDETGFSLERAVGNTSPEFTVIATTSANVVSELDTDILPGTLYSYRVRAFNAGGFSAYSDILELTTPNSAPTDLILTNNSIADKVTSGTLVGTLVLEDTDVNDTGTFSFATGDGSNDADNGSFLIDGNRLITNTTVDINSKSSYKVRVSGTDLGGASIESSLTILVKERLDKSVLYVGDDGFESIRTFDLLGNPIDTLFEGSSIGSFDIDEENQIIYFSDQSTLSLYKSDYDGNIELLYDSIFFQENKELIYDKGKEKIYLSNKGNDIIHEYDLTTGDFKEIVRSNNGDINDLHYDPSDQVFYWRSSGSSGSIINKFKIGTSEIENFELSGRRLSNMKFDDASKILYFINRESGVSGNDPARIGSFNTATNLFSDVSADLEAVFDFDIDIQNSQFFIAGETTLNASVPTDIIRMSFNGVIEEVIFDGFQVVDHVSVDPTGNKVYWIDRSNNITRSNFDGSSLETVGQLEDFIYYTPYLIDELNDKIIAVNNNILKIKDLAVGNDFTFLSESEFDRVSSLALDVDRASLYWADEDLGEIFRSDIDGENIMSIAEDVDPRGLTIDTKRGKLIWYETRTIQMSNLDGSEIETLIQNPVLLNYAFDVDNNELYWHDQTSLQKLNLESGESSVIDTFRGFINTMDIDQIENTLYFVSNDERSKIISLDLGTLAKDTMDIPGAGILNIKLDKERKKIYYSTTNKIGQISYNGDNIKQLASDFRLTLAFDVFINNTAPSDILLSNNTITEMEASGTVIGSLSTIDADNPDSHIYYLDPESPDSENFRIEMNELVSNKEFDFEDISNYGLKIVSQDIAGDTISSFFIINVIDSIENVVDSTQNSVPTDITFTQNQNVSNLTTINTVVGTFSTLDTDEADVHTYTFFSDMNTVNNNEYFDIDENALILSSSLTALEEDSLLIQVTTTDQAGNSFTKDFSIAVALITSIDAVDDNSVKIYPLPADRVVNLEYLNDTPYNMSIVTLGGVEVFSKPDCNRKEVVDISNLHDGLYILNLKPVNGNEIRRLIVID